MSWADWTHAKHFGSGIFRPYSDLLSDIITKFEESMFMEPSFAKFVVPFHARDTYILTTSDALAFVFSTTRHRQYPVFETQDWTAAWPQHGPRFRPEEVAKKLDTAELEGSLLGRMVMETFSFEEPYLICVPNITTTKQGTPEAEIRARSVEKAAQLIREQERLRYERHLMMDIFLSHKSANKSLVREIHDTLQAIGYSPWLDEDRMKAGAPLERALLEGFKGSCAAVFFITPEFRDEGYLAKEVDYAIAEKNRKGERFAVITLVIPDEAGNEGDVPELLTRYVYKTAAPVQIVREIVQALPIKLDYTKWVV